MLKDWDWRTPITDILNLLKRTISTTRRVGHEGKSASRDSATEFTRDGRNEESSRITSRRILCSNNLRESHETRQRLTLQMQEMEEQMNSMNDSGKFQEVESNHRGRLSYVPSQPAASRDKR